RKIYARLIGKTDQHKQYIRHLVSKIDSLIRFFERLFPILPSHYPRYFAYLFHQHGGIRQLVKIAHACTVNPFVNNVLCFFDCHYLFALVSKIMVTGPSLRKSIFMSAPKTPSATCFSCSVVSRLPISWYKGSVVSGFAASIKDGRLPFFVCPINVN